LHNEGPAPETASPTDKGEVLFYPIGGVGTSEPVKNSRTPKFHHITFPPRYGSALRSGESIHGPHGEAAMTVVLNDLLLFTCLAAFVTGIVIAAATLLI
jgi:hypothetical protein